MHLLDNKVILISVDSSFSSTSIFASSSGRVFPFSHNAQRAVSPLVRHSTLISEERSSKPHGAVKTKASLHEGSADSRSVKSLWRDEAVMTG